MTIEMIGDVRGWFHERLTGCMAARGLAASDETTFYLVELLASAGLGAARRDSLCGRPLALILAEASDADGHERLRLFRLLGDEALYVGGFFADNLEHRGVSPSYVSRLGMQAYRAAEELASRSEREAARVGVYAELASQFAPLTRVLDDVRESTALRTPQDIVRLYDRWKQTRSARLAERLAEEGVFPVDLDGETLH